MNMVNHRDKAWLFEHYVERGLSCISCGEAASPPVTAMTIHHWLKRHGIPPRAPGSHMVGARNTRRGKPLPEQTRRKIGKALTGHKRSPESVRKQREKISGPNSHLYGKRVHGNGAWVVRVSGSEDFAAAVFMRSRWEIHFADWLTARGKPWEYEPRTFVLPDGRAYTPDFHSEGVYYEIKGWMNGDDADKIRTFRMAFPGIPFRVLRKADLEALGVAVNDPKLVPRHLTVTGPNTKKCPNCGKVFIPERRASKFCSRECNSGRVRKPRVQWDCAVCGRTTEGPPSDLKYRKACSVACGRILSASKRSGARHWTARAPR